MLDKTPARRPTAVGVREVMQRIALEILDDSDEFASYAITTEPSTPVAETARIRTPRWTPEISMVSGSGYLLVRPQGGWDLVSGDRTRVITERSRCEPLSCKANAHDGCGDHRARQQHRKCPA